MAECLGALSFAVLGEIQAEEVADCPPRPAGLRGDLRDTHAVPVALVLRLDGCGDPLEVSEAGREPAAVRHSRLLEQPVQLVAGDAAFVEDFSYWRACDVKPDGGRGVGTIRLIALKRP
ncbi:hypothetical protein [Crossiella sp. S99.2]|uniref:hypothetical protein n=1 Tax=Crossiella sp. S99.2 TaxID=2936272 RepID=UPI001FFE8998|nr:hypothetical protein [Crossiella sp. S99.2]